jgi:hypothetical protein
LPKPSSSIPWGPESIYHQAGKFNLQLSVGFKLQA